MRILVVTATDTELAPLVPKLHATSKCGPRLKTYRLADHDIDLLTTGVGMVASAAWCSKLLHLHR